MDNLLSQSSRALNIQTFGFNWASMVQVLIFPDLADFVLNNCFHLLYQVYNISGWLSNFCVWNRHSCGSWAARCVSIVWEDFSKFKIPLFSKYLCSVSDQMHFGETCQTLVPYKMVLDLGSLQDCVLVSRHKKTPQKPLWFKCPKVQRWSSLVSRNVFIFPPPPPSAPETCAR